MNPHTPKWTPILGVGFRWILKFLEGDYKGQISLDWDILYIIGKLLERRCLKWDRMTHLNTQNTSYGQKKGHESNWQFNSWPLKVRNLPDFLMCRWCATYCWKDLGEGYNFASDLISIGGLHAKLWVPKVATLPTLGISRLPLGSPRTKCRLGTGLVARYKVYYMGEGDGFPQV
jgi:hypothetical protein